MSFDLKKVFHFLSTVLLYSVFIVMIIVFLAIGAYFVDQAVGKSKEGEYRAPLFGAYVIVSPSMVPNIDVYDVVVTMRKDMDKIKVDDIITFRSEDNRTAGVTITHRVVGIVDVAGGKKAFRTKGDNNNVEDSTLVNYDHIIGEVLFKIPQLGRIQQILTNSSGWLFIIVLPCVGIVIYDLIKLARILFKKKNSEEKKGPSSTISNSEVKKEFSKLEETTKPLPSSSIEPLNVEAVPLKRNPEVQINDPSMYSRISHSEDVASPKKQGIAIHELSELPPLEIVKEMPPLEAENSSSNLIPMPPLVSAEIVMKPSTELKEEVELLDDFDEEPLKEIEVLPDSKVTAIEKSQILSADTTPLDLFSPAEPEEVVIGKPLPVVEDSLFSTVEQKNSVYQNISSHKTENKTNSPHKKKNRKKK